MEHMMSDIQPNFKDFGASEIMGPLLRHFVEQQLAEDLTHYKVISKNLYFDWSESCPEGHSIDYLDGVLENFSYVSVFDSSNNLVAEGWLDFVDNFFDTTAEKKYLFTGILLQHFMKTKKLLTKLSQEFLIIFGIDLIKLQKMYTRPRNKKDEL